MAGLFELQLSNESPRRSNDAPRASVAAFRSPPPRMQSPPHQVSAREIVNQVKERQRQQEEQRQTSTASHFTHASNLFSWRRKGTTLPQDSPRISSDSLNGYSSDTLYHHSSHATIRDLTRRSATTTTKTRRSLTQSPRQSLSLDAGGSAGATVPSPSVGSLPNTNLTNTQKHNNTATTALAQAGFSLSIPSIVFPNPSPSITSTIKRKKKDSITRPGTSHGHDSSSNSSPAVASHAGHGTVRRVKSFTKLEDAMDNQEIINNDSSSTPGDILVFSRHPSKSSALTRSMPEHGPSFSPAMATTSSTFSFFSKGKSREIVSDREDVTTTVESQRGRSDGASTVNDTAHKEREKSLTRRLTWWPRRRVDSSIAARTPPPTTDPPPIPSRSQDRPTPVKVSLPSLPSFRPFSPLLNDFRTPEVKNPRDPSDTKDAKHTDSLSSVKRRHSLGGHSNQSHSTIKPIPSSRPTSQTFSASHRYSLSLNTSEHGHMLIDGALSQNTHPPSVPLNHSPSQASSATLATSPSPSTSTRTRSNTQTSSNSLSQVNRDTPLLLRQPLNRPTLSGEPMDPFHSLRPSAPIQLQQEIPNHKAPPPSRSLPEPVTSSTLPVKSSEVLPANASKLLSATTLNGSSLPSTPPSAVSTRLLRRLSTTLFPSSTTPMLTTPIERSSIDLSSSSSNLFNGINVGSGITTPRTSAGGSSPSRSKENLPPLGSTRNSAEEAKAKPPKITSRLPDETAEEFLLRLLSTVTRAEVAHVLASSGDEFYTQALRLFLTRFKFSEEPLDVALRRLLMEIGLPKETQHIDRMMEAFATRYLECNLDLFVDKDHPYILSFSLIILHTDVFNKSNKNKMTKADYVKNTRLPGVSPEMLEYFYDNIIFAPFIFIEDPADGMTGKVTMDNSRLTTGSPSVNQGNGSSASVLLGRTKVDPYYLITQNMLGPLRADINRIIPLYSPYLFEGTDWPWDILSLHTTFALARVFYVSFEPPSPASPATPVLPSTPGRRKSVAVSVPLPVNLGPFMGSSSPLPIEVLPTPRASMVITTAKHGAKAFKIAKVGTLLRKDDTVDGGRRSTNRKWREFSVVLTGSQLLFFRGTAIASNLLDITEDDDSRRVETEEALLNPDDVLVLSDSIALYDRTYTKYPYAFKFFMPNGRQFILQAPDEAIRNEWISSINYSCSFKSAGVHIRGIGMSHKDIELTGFAAAASHLKDLRASGKPNSTANATIHSFTTSNNRPRNNNVSNLPTQQISSSPNRHVVISNQVDLESPRSLQMEESRLFKATFDEVKAELAQSAGIDQPHGRSRTVSMGSRPAPTKKITRPSTAGSMAKSYESHSSSLTSRSRRDVIQAHVDTLDEKIKEMQLKLEEELRLSRNLAILTPFQRSTRDRIQAALTPLAKKISSLRIEISKYTCYRFVLLSDLAEEERQWEQAKRDALQAASRRLSLDTDTALDTSQEVSYSADDADKQVKVSRSVSTLESFCSSPEAGTTSLATKPSLLAISTDLPALNGQSSELPTPAAMTQSPLGILESSDVAGELHERFYSAVEAADEVAEEWSATRAAKRVSLVRVPSNVKPGRALRNANDNAPNLPSGEYYSH